MIRYRPWVGEFCESWGGDDATDDNIKKTWEEYAEFLLEVQGSVPDFIRREIQDVLDARDTDMDIYDLATARVNDTTDFEGEEVNAHRNNNEWIDADDGNYVNNEVEPQSQVPIEWMRNHDWSVLEHTYENDFSTVCHNNTRAY